MYLCWNFEICTVLATIEIRWFCFLHSGGADGSGSAGIADLPRVERNLRQLMDAGAQLFAKTDNIGSQEVKASVLLGSRGVDLPTMTNALAALATSAQTGTGFEQVSKRPIIELYYTL